MHEKITQALYEIVTGLHGYRDDDHTQWEREAKRYIKKITQNKNVTLCGNTITITTAGGGRELYKITISK